MTYADAVAAEIARLQGTWQQTAYERDGRTNPQDEENLNPRTTFVDNTFTVTRGDGTIIIKGTYKLDPTRTPKTVDWTDTWGECAGQTFPAIYLLEGNQLTFCAADDGGERPTEFKTRKGQVLRVHRRKPM